MINHEKALQRAAIRPLKEQTTPEPQHLNGRK